MKFLIRVVLSVCMAAFLALPAWAVSTLDEVKSKGVLVAGVRNDAPPFGYLDRTTRALVGYDVDYVEAIAAKLGVKAEFKAVDRATRLGRLMGGEVDLLAANVTPGTERGLAIGFSDPYLTTGQGFIAKKGTLKVLRNLVGKKVGVVMGTPSETCARDFCEGGIIVPFSDYDRALDALRKGEIAAFSSDEAILFDLFGTLPPGEFEIPELLISRQDYVLGVRQGDKAFVDFLNATIAEFNKNGTAERIRAKWFSPPTDRTPAAYGAIVRKAAAPPRFLAVGLDGVFFPGAEVSVYGLDGAYIGKGKIFSVLGDQFYLDVEESIYNLVQSGFMVTLNLSPDIAKNIAIRQQQVLQSVRMSAGEEKKSIEEQADKELNERLKRAQELELLQEQRNMDILLERERYRNLRCLFNLNR